MERARAAKVGHTKSRNGCLTCRKRRVKCDEQRPTCGGCERLGLRCGYDGKRKPPLPSGMLMALSDQVHSTAKIGQDSNLGPPDESKDRRRNELRLLHYWMSLKDDAPVPLFARRWRTLWYVDMPRLALENDNLLYALLAVAATRLLQSTPDDNELVAIRDNYWNLALHEQQRAIAGLASPGPMVFAAMLISINAFAETIAHHTRPYAPPVTWLRTARGAWILLEGLEQRGPDSALSTLVELTAPIWIDCETAVQDEHINALLPGPFAIELVAEAEVRACLLKVTKYIRLFQIAAEHEPMGVLSRRVFMFPGAMSEAFIKRVSDGDTRALLLVGRFFAAVEQTGILRHYYQSQDISLRGDIEGIRTLLPPEASLLLALPDDGLDPQLGREETEAYKRSFSPAQGQVQHSEPTGMAA